MNRRLFPLAGVLVLALLALAMPVSVAGQENVLRVGPGQEYATIQAAVMDARQGSQIFVYPATYHENVFVVTTPRASRDNLQIIAQGAGVRVEPVAVGAAFLVLADHVTIQGFEIGFGSVDGACVVGIVFEGSHNTFADNTFYSIGSCQGVNALSSRDADGGSDFNIIERNTIEGADLGIAIDANGATAINRGNVIRDNTLRDVIQTSIGIANGIGFTVSGNRIEGTPGFCILVGPLTGNTVPQGHHTIVNNTLSGCGTNGIALYADPGTVVTHNRIAGNTLTGCLGNCIDLAAAEGSTLANNEVKANSIGDSFSLHGIYLSAGADDNRILDNEVHEAALFGITVAGASNLIAGNVAQGNKIFDLQDLGQDNKWPNNTYDRANW